MAHSLPCIEANARLRGHDILRYLRGAQSAFAAAAAAGNSGCGSGSGGGLPLAISAGPTPSGTPAPYVFSASVGAADFVVRRSVRVVLEYLAAFTVAATRASAGAQLRDRMAAVRGGGGGSWRAPLVVIVGDVADPPHDVATFLAEEALGLGFSLLFAADAVDAAACVDAATIPPAFGSGSGSAAPHPRAQPQPQVAIRDAGASAGMPAWLDAAAYIGGVSRQDAVRLIAARGTVAALLAGDATGHSIAALPGFGPTKQQRLARVFNADFPRSLAGATASLAPASAAPSQTTPLQLDRSTRVMFPTAVSEAPMPPAAVRTTFTHAIVTAAAATAAAAAAAGARTGAMPPPLRPAPSLLAALIASDRAQSQAMEQQRAAAAPGADGVRSALERLWATEVEDDNDGV